MYLWENNIIGTKIAIGIAAVATVGVLGVGGIYIANNGGFSNLFGIEESKVEDDEDIDTDEGRETQDEKEDDFIGDMIEEDIVDWSRLEGVYLYSPDYFDRQGGGFRVTISNVKGALKAEDVTFDVLFETYESLDDTEHSVKVSGSVEGFVDGIATMSGTTDEGVLWEVEMDFFKDGNAVFCTATRTENGSSVTQGYHDPNIAIKTCEEMKNVRNLFDEGDTTYIGTSNGVTYQLDIIGAATLYATDATTNEEVAWQVPDWKLTIIYENESGSNILEYSDDDDFYGLVGTIFTQIFDYRSDFMGYYIL